MDGIVGIGLATSQGVWYFGDCQAWTRADWAQLEEHGRRHGLAAFNAVFDLQFLAQQFEATPRCHTCTLVWYRMLTTESYPGQSWSLESAQAKVLGWPEAQKDWLSEALARHGLSKSEMHRLNYLERAEFAYYCAADADASWQLEQELRWKSAAWPVVTQFATEEYPALIEQVLEARDLGIRLDVPRLEAYRRRLMTQIRAAETRVREHPDVEAWVKSFEQQLAREFYSVTCRTRRVWAKASDEPWLNPEDWYATESLGNNPKRFEQEHGYRWFKEDTTLVVRNENKPRPRLNLNSGPHLQAMLYDHLHPEHRILDTRFGPKVELDFGAGPVELDCTKAGGRPVDKNVLPLFGEVGKAVMEYNLYTKRLGYVDAYLAAARAGGGRIHPGLKPHGTVTGRVAGGS